METGKSYLLFGAHGAHMVPIEQTGLRLGQVVSYGDMANPRQRAAVVETQGGISGQRVIFLEDYHRSTVSKTHIEGLGGWEYEPNYPDLTPGEIAALEKKANQAVIDREIERQVEAKAFEAAKVALRKAYPHLIEGAAAKNIRIELKQAFPKIKFSVRAKSFSGGNDINISWTDGPTKKQVEAIANKYEAGSFDGMTDSYNYNHSPWTEVFGSSKYIFCNRQIGGRK